MPELSGIQWCARFPQSTSVEVLASPFRENVKAFLKALKAAGVTMHISTTYRPEERAYLMHYAGMIARKGMDPTTVPKRVGVDIDWVHKDGKGKPDLAASKRAAEAMYVKYRIAHPAVLNTRHYLYLAIDMTITWSGALHIRDAESKEHVITSTPRTGNGNTELHAIGASYGVLKLVKDPPHWSDNGH